jgi:hypothetical protein
MRPRRVCTTVYLDRRQRTALARLTRRTRVSASAFIREGVDAILRKYRPQKGEQK